MHKIHKKQIRNKGAVSASLLDAREELVKRESAHQPLSRDDAATLCGILDTMCHRYRNGAPADPKALALVFKLGALLYRQPAAYLPMLFAGLDQAVYDARRRGGSQ